MEAYRDDKGYLVDINIKISTLFELPNMHYNKCLLVKIFGFRFPLLFVVIKLFSYQICLA